MSENALTDANSAKTHLAVLNTDSVQGTNKVRIAINPVNDGLKINTTSTISFTMTPIDPRDENYWGVWAFQGSDGQLYPAVATISGELLIDTN